MAEEVYKYGVPSAFGGLLASVQSISPSLYYSKPIIPTFLTGCLYLGIMKTAAFVTLAVAIGGSSASPVAKRDIDITAFLTEIASSFPANVAIADACGAITAAEQGLASYFSINTSSDDASCADVALIFARGTCDPGNLGSLVGPPFVQELQKALGSTSLSVQGVDYAASVDGYLHDDPAGGTSM